MSRRWRWFAKASAGVLGGFLVAVAGTMIIALYGPASERDRMLAAGVCFVPLWVAALCSAGMSRSGRRAWLVNGVVFLVMASLAAARLVWG